MLNFGDRLKEQRLKKKFTQVEFAKRAGLTQGRLSQLENGFSNPSNAQIELFSKILDIPQYFLLQGDETDEEIFLRKFRSLSPDSKRNLLHLIDIFAKSEGKKL